MSRLAEAKELVRQELLEALQTKSGENARDLFELYDKLRMLAPTKGMTIEFPSEFPKYDESDLMTNAPYNFTLSSDYLSATNAETYGAVAAGPVNIPLGGLGADVISFGGVGEVPSGDTIVGSMGTDTITFNTDEKDEDNDTISLG